MRSDRVCTCSATAWALYYYFACESGGGQTLGKRVMRLRVVRADGGEAGMGEIAVRTVLRVVDGIGLYLVGLVVMLVSGKRRQRLGDMAGGTIVVDASAARRSPAGLAERRRGPDRAGKPQHPGGDAAGARGAGHGRGARRRRGSRKRKPCSSRSSVRIPRPYASPGQLDVAEQHPRGPLPEPVSEEPPVVVRSVETVSAIDLVMGDQDEHQSARRGLRGRLGPFAPPARR